MYQGKVRVRAVGLLFEAEKILLLRHEGLGSAGHLWSPPGGGVDFGCDAESTLRKEFAEETHLEITVRKFLFVNEHIDDRHHAIELFFEVERVSGEAQLGHDPEVKQQILSEIAFLSWDEIRQMPPATVHSMFSRIAHLEDMLKLRGYYKFAQD
jgi:8-oxo-dGTP diphosphatase